MRPASPPTSNNSLRIVVETSYSIRPAREDDLTALPAIERAAGELFADYLFNIDVDDTTEPEDFADAQADGLLWVALWGEAPVGFALVSLLPSGAAHLEEIDVHPLHGRRGLGTQLVQTTLAWAAQAGHRALTLTTFRHIPWNMPFYARLGFEELAREELSAELVEIVSDEASRGLDPQIRVVMRYRFGVAAK